MNIRGEKMKKVWLWVAIFPEFCEKRVCPDLLFSSKEKFIECLGRKDYLDELVEVWVPETFNDLDFIPDNY